MVEQFELREKEIFKILEKIKKFPRVVLIGGYALNAYIEFPRFSVDCDLIVLDCKDILKILKEEKFKIIEKQESFVRCEKKVDNIIIGIDFLIGKIIDRLSGITFEFSDIFQDSKIKEFLAKSDPKLKINFRTASPEVLFVIKFASLRKQDVRDIFMLSSYKLDRNKIKKLVKKYFPNDLFETRKEELKKMIMSQEFINSIQGVYGKLPEDFLEKNKTHIINLIDF